MLIIPKVAKIKQLREKAGLSQHQLSLMAGLNGNTIFRIETGESKRTHHLRAREIARVLGCEVTEIFAEKEEAANGQNIIL